MGDNLRMPNQNQFSQYLLTAVFTKNLLYLILSPFHCVQLQFNFDFFRIGLGQLIFLPVRIESCENKKEQYCKKIHRSLPAAHWFPPIFLIIVLQILRSLFRFPPNSEKKGQMHFYPPPRRGLRFGVDGPEPQSPLQRRWDNLFDICTLQNTGFYCLYGALCLDLWHKMHNQSQS